MKKALSIMCLTCFLSLGIPANAAPGGGPAGPPPGGSHVAAGPHHTPSGPPPGGHMVARPHGGPHSVHPGHGWGAPPPPPPHHYSGGRIVVGGVLARHSCWYNPYCDCRLDWYDGCYYPRYRNGMYINVGFPIRF